MKKGMSMLRKGLCYLLILCTLFTGMPQDVLAANYQDTPILNFALDANGLVSGYVTSIDGKTDFTVQNGCIVLEGGFTHKDIPIQIQMNANSYYKYCICHWANDLGQYNRYGVGVTGTTSSNEHWNTDYPKYEGFAHNAKVDITLNYGPYSNVNYPVYGKRVVEVYVRRLSDSGEPEGGGVYRLPLLFVAKKENVTATASIDQLTGEDGSPTLSAKWNLGSNSNIAASYQWYEKVNGTYTKIDGASGQQYVPQKEGTYKVDVTLNVNSALSGVENGTYNASAETTVSKTDPGINIGWNTKYSSTLSVTLNDPVSLYMYAQKPGEFVITKEGQVVKRQTITSDNDYSRINIDFGNATHAMNGIYNWEFKPVNEVFVNNAKGQLTLEVKKYESNASASMSEYISTTDGKGSIQMKADVPGTFIFSTEGKSQEVAYTTAGSTYTYSELKTLIPSQTGTYTMDYRFVPDNATDYDEVTGSMNYVIDSDGCDLQIVQNVGGTVKVNDQTKSLRGTAGTEYTISVIPAEKTSTHISAVNQITVDGTALDESALTRNADGSVTGIFKVPDDAAGKTYQISATYDQRKLVLKDNQIYYYDVTLGFTEEALAVLEQAAWDTVFDAESSIGISKEDVTITYYQGKAQNIISGTFSDIWMSLNSLGYNWGESQLHSFGAQATEQIRIEVKGTDLTSTVTVKIAKRTVTSVKVNDPVAITKADPSVMMQELQENADAKVVYIGSDTAQEIVDAKVNFTMEDGSAIDWSSIDEAVPFTVKASYEGTKTSSGGYVPSSTVFTAYIRPDMKIEAAEKTYTSELITYEPSDFTVTPDVGDGEIAVTGIEGYYDSSKNPCTEIVNTGNYYVKLNLQDAYGSFVSDYVPVKIDPAELNIIALKAKNRMYDGTKVVDLATVAFSGVKSTDQVSIDTAKSTAYIEDKNVGQYGKVSAKEILLSGEDAKNYVIADSVYAREYTLNTPVSIEPKDVTIENILIETSKEYDGTTKVVIKDAGKLLGVYDDDVVSVVCGTAAYTDKTVGNDKQVSFAGFSLEGKDAANYHLAAQPDSTTADITPKTVTVDVVVNDKQYNGLKDATIKSAEVVGVLDNDDVELVIPKPLFMASGHADEEREVSVGFEGDFSLKGKDAANYSLEQPTGIKAVIYNEYQAEKDIDYTVNSNDWINHAFTITAAEGKTISLGYEIFDDNTFYDAIDATVVNEEGLGSISFYVRDEETGAISRKVTEQYKIDRDCPTGTITIGENRWTRFLNLVTGGLFFNEYYDVKIEAEDSLSGVETIEYLEYRSEIGYTLDELKAVEESEWIQGDSVQVSWEEAQNYIYYARITDRAGNVTYICSEEGIEYDVTLPAIDGVEDEEHYYTSQNVVVSDRNLEQVTLDDTIVTENLTLQGNMETAYVIQALDKAGNQTTKTIYMHPIADLANPIVDLTEENVNSDDKTVIESLVSQVETLSGNEDLPQEEKDALQEILDQCEVLLDKIAEVEQAITDIETAIEDITEDGIEMDETEDVEEIIDQIKQTLEDHEKNLTEDEYAQLEEAIEILERILEVVNQIADLSDETLNPGDADDVDAADQMKQAYNALSDHEKTLIGKKTIASMEESLKEITAYKIIEGANGSVTKGKIKDLKFKANGVFKKFKAVQVDGREIKLNKDYTAVSGSTVVTLKKSYLSTLSVGKHTLTVVYEDGNAQCQFQVKAQSSSVSRSPRTGDMSSVLGTTGLMLGSAAVVLGLMRGRKRNTKDRCR